MLYRQNSDINDFLRSTTSVSRKTYFRILALASIDIMLTLPIGIVNVVLNATAALAQGGLPFYWGWSVLHTDWEPVGISYADLKANGTASLGQFYFSHWTSPALAFVIFGLFGLSSEARASYWYIACTVGTWFGLRSSARMQFGQASLGEIEFGARQQDQSASQGDVEMGFGCVLVCKPSYLCPDICGAGRDRRVSSHPMPW